MIGKVVIRSKRFQKRFSVISFSVLFLLTFLVAFTQEVTIYLHASAGAVRGTSGDLWADKILGKRDFGEIANGFVTTNKAYGGGVVVDTSISPGRAYVWDPAHSRIMGVNLADCYATAPDDLCSADFVIGQPSLTDWGACNRDASFQYYPDKAPSTASTLCGFPEWTHTVLEDKSLTSMYVDTGGNLWVYDTLNNRVLEYYTPYTTDAVADQVWGQPDFTSNNCNLTSVYGQTLAMPTASSLCYMSAGVVGAGVTLDPDGNLWVADGGNNRVLRFPNVLGVISKTADLVLGQHDFVSGGDWSFSSDNDRMWAPTVVRFGSDGNLYVADTGNTRVIRFDAPYSNGMAPSATVLDITDLPGGLEYLEMDPSGNYLWTGTPNGPNVDFKKWSLAGVDQGVFFQNWQGAAGSIGFDTDGNILIPTLDVVRFRNNGDDTYTSDKSFFRSWEGGATAPNRLNQGGWAGIEVTSARQLIVTDGRLMAWNDPLNATNGQTPDVTIAGGGNYIETTIDSSDKLYLQQNDANVVVFQAPLTSGESPIQTLTPPFNVLGGGTINVTFITGLAISSDGNYLWINDQVNSRAFRIKNPLTTPIVDMVLGQTDLIGTSCNRGLPANDPAITVNMLCNGGNMRFDRLGNLYISDSFFELSGNWRMLMFAASTMPANPASVVFAPNATKVFGLGDVDPLYPYWHTTLTPAFDSTNRMVVGYNPYAGTRFVEYYNDPTTYNPSDPGDPAYSVPNGHLLDFNSWAFTETFDSSDNLYAYDTNRGRVLIYLNPFNIDHTPPEPPSNPEEPPAQPGNPSPNTPPVTSYPNPGVISYPTTTPISYATDDQGNEIVASTEPTPSIFEIIGNFISNLPQALVGAIIFIEKNIKPPTPLVVGAISAVAVATTIGASTLLASGFDFPQLFAGLIGFLSARGKKYWGIISDETNGKPIPFAIVRLIHKEFEGNSQIAMVIGSTLSDLDGKYRLTAPQDGDFFIEVKASGYKQYYKPINIQAITSKLGDISNDIFLTPMVETQTFIQKILFSQTRRLVNILRTVILTLSLLGCVLTVYAQIVTPSTGNLILLVLYFVMFIVIFYPLIYSLFLKRSFVIDSKTQEPLAGAVVRIYDNYRQIALAMTDDRGVVRFDLEPGEYQAMANKKGYLLSEVPGSTDLLLKVSINNSGYLDKSIKMDNLIYGLQNNVQSRSLLDNPFSGRGLMAQ